MFGRFWTCWKTWNKYKRSKQEEEVGHLSGINYEL